MLGICHLILMGFWSALVESKIEGLKVFRNVNHESVDTVLITVAKDVYTGLGKLG
jgi:hypothetical protein